ncbi:MAG: hypothetical protein ACM3W4_06415 [Ignavibacteriales bacterium]
MKMTPVKLAVAAVLAAGATTASAETYGQAWNAYQAAQNTYYSQQSVYNANQAAYNAARAKYDADRAAYDARWGYGAYERAYGPFVWNSPAYSYNCPATTYPYSSYPATTYPYASYPYASNTNPYSSSYPYSYNPYYAGAYGANSAYTSGVPCSTGSTPNLSMLSALAQAAMGGSMSTSNLVNQAVLGAVVDNALGRQSTYTARCDSRGYYYSYNQTQPYREGYYDAYGTWHATAPSPQYASCRLAPAPTDAYGQTYRYVRVCPDADGRYRITG